jgi:hypothetical protein
MVFLTSIDILDTGFLTKTNRGTQLSTANRVNSGSALRLKGVDLEISGSSNVDKETFPGNTTGAIDCPLISVNPDEFTLTLYLNSSNTDTNNPWGINDVANLALIRRLTKTAGFKAIYYPVSGNIRKRNQQLSYQLGSADTSESQGDINITLATTETDTTGTSGYDLTDVNYIAVRFESFSIKQEPGNSIEVKLNGVIIG